MPIIPRRVQQPTVVNRTMDLPPEFPTIPATMVKRFPELAGWQEEVDSFFAKQNQVLQQNQEEIASANNSRVVYTVDTFKIYTNKGIAQPMFSLDASGVRLGDVLVINTPGRKVYIGAGSYQNNDTPFYVDTEGKFSLGANLTWDPVTATLAITGVITATSGTIGGFDIGADYIRDVANSMGMASTVTGGDDVRFWAGDTFANRAGAVFHVTEAGILTATNAAVLVGTVSGRLTATLAAAINAAGNLITDVVNPRLDSNSKYILSDFNFGATDYAGAVKSGTITWDTATGAITGGSGVVVYRSGIVGAAAGLTTFSINAATGAATFAGALSAPTGNIGGWTIGATTLTGGNATIDSVGQFILGTGNDVVVLSAADATHRIWIGNTAVGSAAFSVTKGGLMTATGATVTGTLTASAGAIGGWTIGASTLTGGNAILSSAGILTLGTVNDVIIASATDATYRLWVGNATAASAAFNVTKAGALTATGATITGTLTATAGSIGGFDIGADYVRDAANSMGLASTVTGGDDVRFWSGATFANRATAPFRVTEAGVLVATSATITGVITASSGAIGGFDIGADYIRDVANSMGMASTVTGGDDVRFWAGATFANRATAPYNVTEAGILTATNAAVIVGTVSGRLTSTLAAAINAAGNVITDLINVRIDTSAKTMLSDFTFGAADYSGALKSGTITWNTTTGALTGGSGVLVYRGGIIGAAAGVAKFTLDAATGAATFAGALSAPTGTIGGWTINATTFTGGNATLDSVGQLILGTVNDVVVLSAADATYRIWIGNATAASAAFNVTKAGVLTATGATITGTLTATAGSIGGFTIGSDYIRDNANSFGLASTVTGGDDVRFWAGDTYTNRATAPFHLTEAGLLTAAGAVIGDFSANWNAGTYGAGDQIYHDITVYGVAGAATGTVYGSVITSKITGTNSSDGVIGVSGIGESNSSVSSHFLLRGVQSISTVTGAGSVQNISGFDGFIILSSTGNVTNNAAFFTANPLIVTSTGDVTNSMQGFLCQDIGRTSAVGGVSGFACLDITPPSSGTYRVGAYYGGVSSGTGKYNLFLTGTAQNYLLGKTGIGQSPSATDTLAVTGTTLLTGNTAITGTLDSSGGAWFGTAALTTGATTGHLYIPTSAGAPTGVPAGKTGQVALQFDTTNNKLYVYDGGWLSTAALT